MKKFSLLLLLAITAGCSSYKPDLTAETVTKKALDLHDKAVCESLTDSKAKDYCLNTLVDSLNFDNAVARLDIKLCDEVKDTQYKTSCVAAITTKQQAAENDTAARQNLMTAQSGTDLKACDILASASMKSQCQTNIILRLAHEQKDIKLCAQLPNDAFKDVCTKSAK